MKINWLAPLPPAKTGVALYSALLLPHLAQRATVRCFTPQKSWDPAIEQWAPVATLEDDVSFWQELNRADLTISHLGNNAFAFGEILEISSRHPSLVVLHEASLFELFRGVAYDIHRDPAAFRTLLARNYGREATWAVEKLHLGVLDPAELAARYPLTTEAIHGALGVWCHHPAAMARVENCGWPALLAYQPLPAPIETAPLPEAKDTPPRKGQESDGPGDAQRPRRLICFGHFPPHHRLLAVLEALASYPRRAALHLDIFGEIPDFAEMARQRDRLGLQNQVLFHGFVLADLLKSTLRNADLALDLRHRPDSGSAVLLEIWAQGVPALVLEDYAEPGLTGCSWLRLASFTEDLHRAWDRLLDQPASWTPLVQEGRRQLEERHSLESYLDGLLGFAECCAASFGEAAQWRLTQRRQRWIEGLGD